LDHAERLAAGELRTRRAEVELGAAVRQGVEYANLAATSVRDSTSKGASNAVA
jgi:hypothetical protein